MLKTIQVKTHHHDQMVDITNAVREAVSETGIREGVCTIFVPHTTAGLTINENADPDVVRDFTTILDSLIPWSNNYRHMEGNSAAHVKASMMGFSEQVLVNRGHLVLGAWQGIYLCEYDGPRLRKVHIKIIEG